MNSTELSLITDELVSNPCIIPTGPLDAKIALVGEAPGAQEEALGLPFVGESGKELDRCLEDAKINASSVFKTNVFKTRPPQNKLAAFCLPSKPEGSTFPAIEKGKHISPVFYKEILEMEEELARVNPNVIVALGNTACWALLQQTTISRLRGRVHFWKDIKVLPTYHPAAILRQWEKRPILIADLMKARIESYYREFKRTKRKFLIDPTLWEVEQACKEMLTLQAVSCDIETYRKQISCIGFAPSHDRAITIPFIDHRKRNRNYWESEYDEVTAWNHIKTVLESPNVVKIFQNGLYDIQYLARMGIRICNWSEDTMILHHALFPELPKGLDFMASIYTNEVTWKHMRKRTEITKRDE